MIVEAGTMNMIVKQWDILFKKLYIFLLKTLAVLINQSKRTVKFITIYVYSE